MKIDSRKLYALGNIDINEEINFPHDYYKNTDIIRMTSNVVGTISINNLEEIIISAKINGVFVLPCSITLEEVNYPFQIEFEEIIPDTHIKDNFNLEILDILWENTVLELPLKVVKENLDIKKAEGKGWKLIY